MFKCSTGPSCPLLGALRGRAGTLRIWAQERDLPSLRPGGPSLGSSPEKKTLVLTPRGNSVHYFRHIPQDPEEERGGGEKSFGASTVTKLRFHPQASTFPPPPGEASASSPSGPQIRPREGPRPPMCLHPTRRKAGAASRCPRRTRTFSRRDSETRRV